MAGVVWECPLDILLTTSSMQHWPSIVFKLFHRSIWLGRCGGWLLSLEHRAVLVLWQSG